MVKRKIEVIIFRFVNDSYEYLLLKRIPAKGGFWQPVSGGLEGQEKLSDAVTREVKEETGITKIKRIIEGVYEFNLEEALDLKEYVFGAEIDPKARIVFDKNIYQEHDDHRWCLFEEAIKLLKWPGNKEGLRKLHKILEEE